MRALIVGHGRMGSLHGRTARSLGLEVVTVDPDVETDAHYSSVYEAPQCDLAVIATPPADLAENAIYAASKGMDVLVEKPCATEMGDAIFLHDLGEYHRVRIQPGFIERFNPVTSSLPKLLPVIGPLRYICGRRFGADRDMGISPAMDLAIHDVDLIRHLGVEDVYCELQCGHGERERRWHIEGEDGTITVDFDARTAAAITRDGVTAADVPAEDALTRQWRAFLDGSGPTMRDAVAALWTVLDMEARTCA